MKFKRAIQAIVMVLCFAAVATAQQTDAELAMKEHQWEKAQALYQKAVLADAQNGNAWYNLGLASLEAGHPQIAIEAFQKSSSLRFLPGLSLYNLACAYARTGDNTSALDTLTSLAAQAPRLMIKAADDADLTGLKKEEKFTAALAKAQEAVAPCKNDPVSRQFDFWAGDWDVNDQSGNHVGTSHIEKSLDGCVLIENWQGGFGDTGKSLNTYNAGANKWQQYWVSSSGTVTMYEGEFRDGAMRFSGTTNGRRGSPGPVRLTFTPLPDGRVRQFGEGSSDGGRTWTTSFDLIYIPKK